MLTTGKLQQTINDIGVRGLTSNPTIFEKAISGGTDYDDQISELLGEGKSAQDIFEALEVSDLQGASISSARSTTRPTAATGSARSRSSRMPPATPTPPGSRPGGSGTRSTGRI